MKPSLTKTSLGGRKERTASLGFTIVEVIVTIALAGLFVGVFVVAIQAYQSVRFESERRAEAYSAAQQLAIHHRGATSDTLDCTNSTRQAIHENQPINLDPATEGGIGADAGLLAGATYSVLGHFVEGCSKPPRVIIKVTYGPPAKREDVESIAL